MKIQGEININAEVFWFLCLSLMGHKLHDVVSHDGGSQGECLDELKHQGQRADLWVFFIKQTKVIERY